jgi:hypothetical protein
MSDARMPAPATIYGPLCVVLMGLRVTKVDQEPIAHVLCYETALYGAGDAFLVSQNKLVLSMRQADCAVDELRSPGGHRHRERALA